MRIILYYPCCVPRILMLLADGAGPTPKNEDHTETVNIGTIVSLPHILVTVIYHGK
jgi:hypothetical protein